MYQTRLLLPYRSSVILAALLFLFTFTFWQAQTASAQTPWNTDSNGNVYTISGNVGIGSTSPNYKLSVGIAQGGTEGVMGAAAGINTSSDLSKIRYGIAYTNAPYGYMEAREVWNASSSFTDTELGFTTLQGGIAVSERMTIKGNGNVGIGETAPTAALHLKTNAAVTVPFKFTNSATGKTWHLTGGSADDNFYLTETGVDTRLTLKAGGNIGIGTTGPNSKLQVNAGNVDGIDIHSANSGYLRLTTDTGGTARNWAIAAQYTSDYLEIMRSTTNGGAPTMPMMTFDTSGNVGIGTTPDSTYKLNVNGSINAKYQDVAEWVPSSRAIPAGTVVILDPTKSNQVLPSSQAYDTKVAGVISAQPGISLGEGGEGKVLVATTGRVKVKVDATKSPIHVGDILVTSDKEGIAMKSEPVNIGGVQIHRPGTIIGKALEPLESGVGEIRVLLSLQ